jgi:ABC-2 type transport system ATP-binding protein
VSGQQQTLRIQTDAHVDVQPAVLRELAGVRLGRVETRAPTLEDAYVAIVNSTRAEAAA